MRSKIETEALKTIREIITENEGKHLQASVSAVEEMIRLEEKRKSKLIEEYAKVTDEAEKQIGAEIKLVEKRIAKLRREHCAILSGKVPFGLSKEESSKIENALKAFYNVGKIHYGEVYTLTDDFGIALEVEAASRKIVQTKNYVSTAVRNYEKMVFARRV